MYVYTYRYADFLQKDAPGTVTSGSCWRWLSERCWLEHRDGSKTFFFIFIEIQFTYNKIHSFSVQLLGHIVTLCLIPWGTSKPFSKEEASFTFPPAIYGGSTFYMSLPTLVILYFCFVLFCFLIAPGSDSLCEVTLKLAFILFAL